MGSRGPSRVSTPFHHPFRHSGLRHHEQADWGETEDSRSAPVNFSLDLPEGLHSRWAFFLRSLSKEDFARTYLHPEMGKVSLETTLQLYAWHGKHYLGHVKLVAEAE